MVNFFSTIEITNNGYKGIVYNQVTNTKVYETSVYETQQSVINDVNNYISTQTRPDTSKITSNFKPNVITTTVQLQPGSIPKRGSCCGRG